MEKENLNNFYKIKCNDMYVKSFIVKSQHNNGNVWSLYQEVTWTNQYDEALICEQKIGQMIMGLFGSSVILVKVKDNGDI